MRSHFVFIVALLAAFGWDSPQNLAADSRPAVVVISVDGLAAFYWNDPKAEMPAMRRIAREGASASAMHCIAPTVTWPNHTTLVTGVRGARHGVVGNEFYDRSKRRVVSLMTDPAGDKEALVRVTTIYDVAKAQGISTAAIRWPATRGAKALDWTLPDVFSSELLLRYSTPQLVEECKREGIWSDGERTPSSTGVLHIVSDETCTQILDFILDRHQPRLALVHLTRVDNMQHAKGPRSPEAYAAIQDADAQVRQIWEQTQRVFGNNATLLIVSDHGFSPVEKLVLPNVALAQAGLVERSDDNKAADRSIHVVVQGGAALVYLLGEDQPMAKLERVQAVLSTLEGVAKVVGPDELAEHGLARPQDDPRSPDLLVFAKEGYAFGSSGTGSSAVLELAEKRGAHGHDAHSPAMDATFVAWGRRIRGGARLGTIDSVDVAPTIARLLDIKLPAIEGKSLESMLAD